MNSAVLGLGGNMGDPRSAMAEALRALERSGVQVRRVSRLYRTPPWGLAEQPDFLNACALVGTELSPEALLEACLSVERELKRVRRERWGPRAIDIDILDYDGEVVSAPGLTLPHPRATERAFVLVPFAEILPDRPIAGRIARDWLEELDASEIVPVSADGKWWREVGNGAG